MSDVSIQTLLDLRKDIHRWVQEGPDGWDSLVINRAKPETTRIFRQEGDLRICLHIMSPCKEEEALGHPHAWPSAWMILDGGYNHWIGTARNGIALPYYGMKAEMSYSAAWEMTDPLMWHKVQPKFLTYTIGITGPKYKLPHDQIRTTAGKGLKSLDRAALAFELDHFDDLMHDHYFSPESDNQIPF